MPSTVTPAEIEAAIRNVPDFPKPGIQFKDITPVLADARLFSGAIDLLTAKFSPGSIDAVVGVDARGFIFAAAAAKKLHAGFVPACKKNKLPVTTTRYEDGSRDLLIDALLATGGTSAAAAALVQKLGAKIVEAGFLIELKFLNGRDKLSGFPVRSLIAY